MYKKGDKVLYSGTEKGIVKQDQVEKELYVFVTFHCNEDWDNYENYTSCLTPVEHLTKGWVTYEE